MPTSSIHVILADDHAVVRRGIREFFTEAGDIVVVGEAETGQRAFEMVCQHRPDVAVLDMQMPNGSGIDVTRRLRAEGFNLGILILTAFDDQAPIRCVSPCLSGMLGLAAGTC